ncbi:hypothetical protein LZ30DRAFT_36151 [Colletotrichum cereale]|nr:hypothetical protein LZ30DRAFT_36151 [Colletotrichum cereale]
MALGKGCTGAMRYLRLIATIPVSAATSEQNGASASGTPPTKPPTWQSTCKGRRPFQPVPAPGPPEQEPTEGAVRGNGNVDDGIEPSKETRGQRGGSLRGRPRVGGRGGASEGTKGDGSRRGGRRVVGLIQVSLFLRRMLVTTGRLSAINL